MAGRKLTEDEKGKIIKQWLMGDRAIGKLKDGRWAELFVGGYTFEDWSFITSYEAIAYIFTGSGEIPEGVNVQKAERRAEKRIGFNAQYLGY